MLNYIKLLVVSTIFVSSLSALSQDPETRGNSTGGGGSFARLNDVAYLAIGDWLQSDAGVRHLGQNAFSGTNVEIYQVRQELFAVVKRTYQKLATLVHLGALENRISADDLKLLGTIVNSFNKTSGGLQLQLLPNFEFAGAELPQLPEEDRRNLPNLMFINVPDDNAPTRGKLLVNMAKYPEFLKAGLVTVPYSSGAPLIVDNRVLQESLVGHELAGLAQLEDANYEMSATFPYLFSDAFAEREIEKVNEYVEAAHADIVKLKDSLEGLALDKELVVRELTRVHELTLQIDRQCSGALSLGQHFLNADIDVWILDRDKGLSPVDAMIYNCVGWKTPEFLRQRQFDTSVGWLLFKFATGYLDANERKVSDLLFRRGLQGGISFETQISRGEIGSGAIPTRVESLMLPRLEKALELLK